MLIRISGDRDSLLIKTRSLINIKTNMAPRGFEPPTPRLRV